MFILPTMQPALYFIPRLIISFPKLIVVIVTVAIFGYLIVIDVVLLSILEMAAPILIAYLLFIL